MAVIGQPQTSASITVTFQIRIVSRPMRDSELDYGKDGSVDKLHYNTNRLRLVIRRQLFTSQMLKALLPKTHRRVRAAMS